MFVRGLVGCLVGCGGGGGALMGGVEMRIGKNLQVGGEGSGREKSRANGREGVDVCESRKRIHESRNL